MSRDSNLVDNVLASLKNIGTFTVSPLRESKTGACYRAVDPARRIAISIRTSWPTDFADPAAAREQLLSQARAAQALDHGNIAKVIGCGELDGGCFIVATFIDGRTVRYNLWNGEGLTSWDLIDVARQASIALEFTASRGIVHHALHPGNAAIEHDGSLKILDFGLFRGNRPNVDPFHESAVYVAPEQFDGHAEDLGTNLFSLAIMLYEIAAGKQPFTGNSWAELQSNLSAGAPEPLKVKSSVPPGINAALMKALAYKRSERFQSSAELVNALENYKSFGKPISIPATPAPLGPEPVSVGSGTAAAPARNPFLNAPPVPPPIKIEAVKLPPPPPPVVEPDPLPLAPEPDVKSRAQIAKEAAKEAALVAATNASGYAKKQIRRVDPWVAGLVGLGLIVVLFIARTVVLSFSGPSDVAKIEQPAPVATPAPGPAAPPQDTTPPTDQSTAAAPQPFDDVTVTSSIAPTRVGGRKKVKYLATSSNASLLATGSIMISTVPAGAHVSIDGRPGDLSYSPQLISALTPGMHTVTLTKEGYAPATRTVQVTGGAQSMVNVQLDILSAVLSVASNPAGAYILVDGANSGKLTPSQLTLAPGTHSITLRKLGFLEATDSVTVKGGDQASRNVALLAAGSTADIHVVAPVGSHKLFGGGKVNGVRVTVHTSPSGATILINGQSVTKPTPVDFGLNPGNYVMEVQMNGYQPLRKTITVEDGKPLRIDETLQP